ncbi:hypothetical protein D0Q02_19275 [Micromonospora craniellae]|uniref:Uncharacterized protein n=1 Tax=Micromonospora craniellae TaxID=2294034 RepID=A0A372FWS6_9ACTN|nr:hypothetical protein D0Q02_19275 [Micromonospora craniellae]
MRWVRHVFTYSGGGQPDVTYRFESTTEITNPNVSLHRTGAIDSLDSENGNRRRFYSLTRIGTMTSVVDSGLPNLRSAGRATTASRGPTPSYVSGQVLDGTFHSAVYPDLPVGTYTVWWDGDTPVGTVRVAGGVVADSPGPPAFPRLRAGRFSLPVTVSRPRCGRGVVVVNPLDGRSRRSRANLAGQDQPILTGGLPEVGAGRDHPCPGPHATGENSGNSPERALLGRGLNR